MFDGNFCRTESEISRKRRSNMAARVTLQDIADELGVSRNTVSKAINNTGLLAEGTREKVIRKRPTRPRYPAM